MYRNGVPLSRLAEALASGRRAVLVLVDPANTMPSANKGIYQRSELLLV